MKYLRLFSILLSCFMATASINAMEQDDGANRASIMARKPAGLVKHLSSDDLRINPCVLVHLAQEEYQPGQMVLTLADTSAFDNDKYDLMGSLYASLARDLAPDLFPYGGWLEEQIPAQHREQLLGLTNEAIIVTPALLNRVLYLNSLVHRGVINFGDTSLAPEHRSALISPRVETCFIGYDLLSLAKARAFGAAFYEVLREAHFNSETQEVEWGDNFKVRMGNERMRTIFKEEMQRLIELSLTIFSLDGLDIQKRMGELNVLSIISRKSMENVYGAEYIAQIISTEEEADGAAAVTGS